MHTFRTVAFVFTLVALWLIGAGGAAWSSTVLQTSMTEMTEKAELIFEGRVVEVESRLDEPGHNIHTYVTFEVLAAIKGEWPEKTIELRFLGGQVGDQSLQVSESNFPDPGEHGIYFVESLTRFQVNPIFGWAQGHFLIRPDNDGVLRVHTFAGEPVVGLGETPGSTAPEISSGVARGLRVPKEAEAGQPLTPDEFKALVAGLLEEEKH